MMTVSSVFELQWRWRYHRPSGVWRSEYGDNVLQRIISNITGAHILQYVGPLNLTKPMRVEFGRAYPKSSKPTVRQFALLAASWMAPGRLWIEAPHFRRSDDSVLECECGALISPRDRDFGRGFDQHREKCTRIAVSKQKPGDTIAIYGIAADVGVVKKYSRRDKHADEIEEGASL